MTSRRGGAVKIIKADGTVEVQPAYTPRQVAKIRYDAEAAAAKGVTRSGYDQFCSDCGALIETGTQMVGFIGPSLAFHWPLCRDAVYSERRRRGPKARRTE